MQVWGCKDLPCYVCFTFSGPLTDSLMLCTLWISKAVHLPVSANDAALPVCCLRSFSVDAFHFISVAFVIMSALKKAEYFYTHKQKNKTKNTSPPWRFPPAAAWPGLIMGTTETTAASLDAGYCYKLLAQSTMCSFTGRFGGWLRWCECRHTGW